jgi:cysteinyl-tRNA synthetase, unknown class
MSWSHVAAASAILTVALPGPVRADEPPLGKVRSWAYQLQHVDPLEIKTSPYDLVVIDYGFDNGNRAAFPREVVDMMRLKPNGSRRFVFAYFSIGEAENYRYYWQDSWLKQRPEWLEPENPQWPGNYLVRYWHPDWQALLLGNPDAYLDRIVAAGFDGVYLDGIDKFEQWKRRRPSAANDMIDLVVKIAAYARARDSGFLVIPQNGDDLLPSPRLLAAIDGYAREDLLYSEDEEGTRNSSTSIAESVMRLKSVTRAGKPVLVVEYPSTPQLGPALLAEIRKAGFIGYVADRALNSLSPPAVGCGRPDCSR